MATSAQIRNYARKNNITLETAKRLLASVPSAIEAIGDLPGIRLLASMPSDLPGIRQLAFKVAPMEFDVRALSEFVSEIETEFGSSTVVYRNTAINNIESGVTFICLYIEDNNEVEPDFMIGTKRGLSYLAAKTLNGSAKLKERNLIAKLENGTEMSLGYLSEMEPSTADALELITAAILQLCLWGIKNPGLMSGDQIKKFYESVTKKLGAVIIQPANNPFRFVPFINNL